MRYEQPPEKLTWYHLGPLMTAEAGRLTYDHASYPIHGISNNAVACYWCRLLADGPDGMVLTDDGQTRLDAWRASPEGQRWLAELAEPDSSGEVEDRDSAPETAPPTVLTSGVQPSLFEAVAQ